MEYQKHYQLPIVLLLDANRAFENRHNRSGWPFLMLVDKDGRVLYKETTVMDRAMPKIAELLEEMLQDKPAQQAVKMDGVSYMPATLERSDESEKARRRDRFPSLACGPDGKVYVVFTSNRNGNSDVFIRVFDGKTWSEDKPLAASAADEFDGTVVVDKENRVWVSWTSNTDGKNYNIFATTLPNPADVSEHVQITYANDDAMHARMACDKKGRVWITYYKWHKIGPNSRDKEVYVRYFDGSKWSDEVRVSPTDVSEYEDHSDPAIATYGDSAIVCWSWDFHQPEGYTKEAKEPSIFARRIPDTLKLGKIISISGQHIDVTPAITVDNDRRIWYTWDSLDGQQKTLGVKDVTITGRRGQADTSQLSKPVVNVCTPNFAVSPTGIVTLVWSQTLDGKRWTLKRAKFDSKTNSWSKARTIELKGNPRFCSAAYDNKGQLWVSYSAETDIGREIIARNLGEK